jgi:hypothetical protein
MDDSLTSLQRYSHGEILAERAADEMGTSYNVVSTYCRGRLVCRFRTPTARSSGNNSNGLSRASQATRKHA